MDENKIVPTPEDVAENADEAVAPAEENEAAESVEAVETVETEEAVVTEEISDEDEQTAEFSEEEVFADEVTETEEKPKKKKKRIGAKIAIGILVALIAFIVFCFVYVYIASKPPKVDFESNAMTVGETEISAAEFFLHCGSVQGSSVDEIKQGAIDISILYNAIYAQAKKEGYEMPESDKKDLEDQLAQIQTSAETAGKTVDEYVEASVADGVTFDMIKEIFEKEFYVNSYYESKIKTLEDSFKSDDGLKKLETAYTEKKATYDLADFSYWYFDASAENAETTANAVAADVKGGKSFADALKAVDSAITAVTVTKETKASLEAAFNKDAAEWLYKTDDKGAYVNGTGAVEVFKDDTFVYVVCVNNTPSKNTTFPVTANYIRIAVDTDTSVKTAGMNKLEAKKTADKILAEFLATDKSAEKLTEIAGNYTKTNKKVTSSSFENAANDGSLDAAVENWLFDAARKEKDVTTQLIEAEDAYYILYYAEKSENAVWSETMINSLLNEESSELRDGFLAEGKKNFVLNEESVNEVIALIEHMSSQSAYSY